MVGLPRSLLIGLLAFCPFVPVHAYDLEVTGGTFYGPGNIPDSPLAIGRLSNLELTKPLTGAIPFFNNGSAEPNLAGEKQLMGRSEGRLSDGRLYNENTDDGVTSIGNGILEFFITVAADGPNKGQGVYTLQNDLNLEIRTDLALDPGFKEGLVVSENLRITTGLLWTPFSLQRQQGMQGGVEQAGSLPSGAPVLGMLGDYDADGFLEGDIIGASNVPLGHVFSPGAPVLQVRKFRSDIPMPPEDSATFILASVHNIADIWRQARDGKVAETAQPYVFAHLPDYVSETLRRVGATVKLLDKYLEANSLDKSTQESVMRIREELNAVLKGSASLEGVAKSIAAKVSFAKVEVQPLEMVFEQAASMAEEMTLLFEIRKKYQL